MPADLITNGFVVVSSRSLRNEYAPQRRQKMPPPRAARTCRSTPAAVHLCAWAMADGSKHQMHLDSP